ncbi:MAG: CAP domain-containing protein [Hyphomicrobiaceae bacterium]
MFRVATALALALLLPGCSFSLPALPFGFGSGSSPAAGAGRQAVAGGELARRDDKAPRGSYEKAPGGLADRDYQTTRLDVDRAREFINAYRKKKGLRPLTLNAELTAAAKNHSKDLARWDRISHFGSDGSSPWDRVKRTGYNPRLAAENVGTGQASIEEVLKSWQQSAGHNKNLLMADAVHMGIALVHDGKTEFKTFWTLVVGTPM